MAVVPTAGAESTPGGSEGGDDDGWQEIAR